MLQLGIGLGLGWDQIRIVIQNHLEDMFKKSRDSRGNNVLKFSEIVT